MGEICSKVLKVPTQTILLEALNPKFCPVNEVVIEKWEWPVTTKYTYRTGVYIIPKKGYYDNFW